VILLVTRTYPQVYEMEVSGEKKKGRGVIDLYILAKEQDLAFSYVLDEYFLRG